MSEFSFYEHAKAHYEFEFDRKRELREGIRLTSTLTAIMAGAIYGLGSTAPKVTTSWGIAEVIPLMFAAIYLACVVFNLSWSHSNHAYHHLGFSRDLHEIRRRDRANGTSWSQIDTSTMVQLERELSDSASSNQLTNDIKSGYLHKANSLLIVSISFLMISGLIRIVSKVI